MQVDNVNLPIKITARHMELTDPMRECAIRKIQGLHLDYPKIIEAHVILGVEKYRHAAEILLVCTNHITIEAKAETHDMYASIDECIAKIGRRMRKFKTRILKHHRPRKTEVRHFDEQTLDLEGFEINDGDTIASTEKLKYPVKPMYVDEAVLQMQLSQTPFIVFINAETNKLNVLHRRKDKSVGLIDAGRGEH